MAEKHTHNGTPIQTHAQHILTPTGTFARYCPSAISAFYCGRSGARMATAARRGIRGRSFEENAVDAQTFEEKNAFIVLLWLSGNGALRHHNNSTWSKLRNVRGAETKLIAFYAKTSAELMWNVNKCCSRSDMIIIIKLSWWKSKHHYTISSNGPGSNMCAAQQ